MKVSFILLAHEKPELELQKTSLLQKEENYKMELAQLETEHAAGQAHAEELRADGFFITGDLGMIDDQGYVQIVGRNKDLIISRASRMYFFAKLSVLFC